MIDQFDTEEMGARLAPSDPDLSMSMAIASMRDETFIKSSKFLEQQWRANRTGAHIDILDFERLFVRRLRKLNVPIFAHNMVRTAADQAELYVRGVTNSKQGTSPHNFGCAVDLVHSTKAWGLTRSEWAMLGHIGKEISAQHGFNLVWGGDWNFYDPAHWELADWRRYAAGRASF